MSSHFTVCQLLASKPRANSVVRSRMYLGRDAWPKAFSLVRTGPGFVIEGRRLSYTKLKEAEKD